jgi:pyrroline-5-carboxylate reductase
LAIRSDLDLAILRNNVTSKNGVTQAGLEQLRQDGILDTLTLQTFQAAYARAVELR